jgi:type III secretion protein V
MSILDDDAMPGGQKSDDEELTPTLAVPLAIVLSENFSDMADAEGEAGKAFRASLKQLRSTIYYDLGVLVPPCFVSSSPTIEENGYFIAVSEVPVSYGKMSPDKLYVNESPENIKAFGLEGEPVEKLRDLMPGAFIAAKDKELAVRAGLSPMSYEDFVIHHLSKIITKYAHTFMGIEETSGYLDFVASGMPRLVEEVTPQIVSIHVITEVLRRLVQENISIRDLRTIMNALAQWGLVDKDPAMLTEYVRTSLARYIAFRYTRGRDTLFVYLLDVEIEDVIRTSIRRTQTGSFLSLDPAIAHEVLDAIRREIGTTPPHAAQQPVLITDMELRRFVRKMTELEFPQLAVISYQELPPELNVQPLARISLRPAAGSQMNDEDVGNAMMMLESQRKFMT